MRKILFLLMLTPLLFAGSLSQTYHMKVYESGDSVISQSLDLTFLDTLLPEGALSDMQTICVLQPELECSVEVETKMLYLSRSFSDNDPHYNLEVEQGLPYSTYRLTLEKLPNDRLLEALNDITAAAGISPNDDVAIKPVDLTDETTTSMMATGLRLMGMEMAYEIEMPGEIVSANSGNVQAQVSGSTATFDMVEVLEESEVIVVTSRQVNWLLIILICMVIAVAALALSFVRKKRPAPANRKAKPSRKPVRRKKRE